ncbi:MAG: protein kinase, partial [Solirubrobacterales bacterium]|nr:protein kinase [Solirubrobacterales bacterium]
MQTLIGERYEVLGLLGIGGEGRVVKALDRRHDRLVTLKIRPVRDDQARAELLGEARILLGIPPHPALPLVREDFFDGDDYLVAMDWVDGTDLATLLVDRGRPGLAPSSVLAYLSQAAEALTHLHSQVPPVIHGDVKPANLILTTGGQIKLVDFGISSAPNALRRRIGTPGYRAPELASDGAPSRASDVYALAATAFALLTGSAPSGVLPTWEGIEPSQAEQLEAAIRTGMATDPARRPTTPGELIERLRAGWAEALPTGVISFCLSDIDGSSEMWRADPAAMAEALVRHDELIADCVESRGGRFLKSIGEGDSSVSVFDSATSALEAAVAATRALSREPWPKDLHVAARFGLHTGEAERRGTDYGGSAIALAAQVRGQAEGGQIILSSVTAQLVAGHLPAGCELVDLGPHRLRVRGEPERIHAVKAADIRAPLAASACPYRGLLPFEPEDRDYFFGREQLVEELIGRLRAGRLAAVVGASGSGKSSLLRAGVIAAVRAGEVHDVRHASLLRPGSSPELDLPDDPAILVVVDQFEELFILCDDPDRRRAFVEALLAVPGPVLIGVRADMYGKLLSHPELARAVAANQLPLGAMSGEELERAVSEPARLAGLRLEPGLVELAVRDVAGEPGALPLLSHALRATWERREGRTLTVEAYRETGGVASAIAQTGDSVVASLPPEGRQIARNVFLRLTELGDGAAASRRRATIEELVPEGVPPEAVATLLERLAEARLVTLGEGTAEVAHEVLIREWPTLRSWLEEDREGLRLHHQLGTAARNWDTGGQDPSDLYRGARLAAASDWAEHHHAELNATERRFLDSSRREADRERRTQLRANRRLRALLAGALALLLIAVVAGVIALVQKQHATTEARVAVVQKQHATTEARVAVAQQLGAEAVIQPRIDLAMLLAREAVNLDPSQQTESTLLATLLRSPAAIASFELPIGVRPVGLALSPDGRTLLVEANDGTLYFYDPATLRQQRPAISVVNGDLNPVYSPDGSLLLLPNGDDTAINVFNAHTLRRVALLPYDQRYLTTGTADNSAESLFVSPDRKTVYYAYATTSNSGSQPGPGYLDRWALPSGRLLSSSRVSARGLVAIRLVDNGTRLIVLGDTAAEALDARTLAPLRTVPVNLPAQLSVVGDVACCFGTVAAISPDGTSAAVGGFPDGTIRFVDLSTGSIHTAAGGHTATVQSVRYSPNGRLLVSTADDDKVIVWNAKTAQPLQTLLGHAGRPTQSALSADGRTLYTSSLDGTVIKWDLGSERRFGRPFTTGPPAPTLSPAAPLTPPLAMSPDGSEFAALTTAGNVGIFYVGTLHRKSSLGVTRGSTITALAWSPNGAELAVGGDGGLLQLWDVRGAPHLVRSLGALRPTSQVPEAIQSVAFSADNRLIAASDFSNNVLTYATTGRIAIWRTRTGALVTTALKVPVAANDVAFSPDGRLLAVALGDEVGLDSEGPVLILDSSTGRQIRTIHPLEGDNGGTISVAFAPNGTLATGTYAGVVQLWNPSTGDPIGHPVLAAAAPVASIAFDRSGQRFVTA